MKKSTEQYLLAGVEVAKMTGRVALSLGVTCLTGGKSHPASRHHTAMKCTEDWDEAKSLISSGNAYRKKGE